MKMKYIGAASLAICVGSALAQSNVTLYGVVDMNIEYATNQPGATAGNSGNRVSMQSGGLSGSRWGLRGTEDLGGGNSALFVLESGFNADNGTMGQGGLLFGRQAFVGLQSASLGKLTFGRQYTTLFDLLANFSPTGYATQYEPVVVGLGLDFRSNNAVKYTGVFGPITAEAHYAFGTGANSVNPLSVAAANGGNGPVAGQFRANSGYGAGVAYSAGPFGATVGYDQFNPAAFAGGAFAGSGSVKKAAIAGSYTLGPAKLMAGYRWGKNKDFAGNEVLGDDYYWAGANYQVTTALGLTLAYSYEKMKNVGGVTSGLSNPWELQFVANYTLSKRTDLYLTTAYAKNAGLALDQAGVDLNATGYGLAAGKDKMLGAALGVRHKF
ncbi:porin [Ralstonia soli]|uniref:Porin n=1 Tax=Ralstonia soli TaxID=2953896 RepID=A0ABT1AUC2_9RALS|nr:porin [Ralstonia soli]MCO5401607.1 porin [Ralstonia soli]